MTAAGCRWGVSWDLETPLYFAPSPGFVENLTLKRSNAHDIAAAECMNARENVGMMDITGFSRYEVTGPNAPAWLDRWVVSKLPGPGRARLAPMLAENGRLKGDLTLFNWGDGNWRIMGSHCLRAWHLRWFDDHLDESVSVHDLGEESCGFGLTGPNSRKVISKLTDEDIGSLPFMGCGGFGTGLVRAKVGRMSVAGEPGYEINCRYGDHIKLRRMLSEAGAEFDLREYGSNAMLSVRLEKSFGIWPAEFTQLYIPGETGLDRWIAWDKGEFIGKAGAIAERDGNGPSRKFVTLAVAPDDADASGHEPVWPRSDIVAFLTSGGYGHAIQKSLAMALVDTGSANEGQALSVHIVGKERPARVIATSLYDPQGSAMRG